MAPKTAYVLKMFPRFSQTFVVNELLAHQSAGRTMDIFSLRLPNDVRFHESIARVESPVHRIDPPSGKSASFLATLQETCKLMPGAADVVNANPGVTASDMEQAMQLACRVRQMGIEHLHAHFATIATTTSRIAAAMAGITYSFTAHAKDIFHESVDPQVLRAKLADAAAVITVSEYNVQHLRANFGSAAERVVHIDNGLDLAEFPYSQPVDRLPLIFAVGRLIEKKGFTHLIAACERLAASGVEFRCEIAGAGELEEALTEQAAVCGLAGRVKLIGPQPQSVIRRKLAQASALAVPCVVASNQDRDGLPTILLEGMAMGTPCVSTDVTGIPEVLRDGETGLMVGQGDAGALATACARLLAEPATRVVLSERAREVIESRFDITDNACRIREVFDSIAAGDGKPVAGA